MQSTHTEKLVLEIEHVDLNRRWTLASILTAMQTVADIHANGLHAGRDHVLGKGAYWVIARLRVDMRRYPRYLDEVSLTTWPGAPERLTFPRYFHFRDSDGQLLGTATSMYMLLSADSHDIVPPAKIDVYDGIDIHPETCPAPGRINPAGDAGRTLVRTPVYSDIDLNRHMNNTRYAQWVCDMFPTDRFAQSGIGSFQLNYVSDGIEGHGIRLALHEDGERFALIGDDTVTGKNVFKSAGNWQGLE